MKDSVKNTYTKRAHVLKAFAHPARLLIVDELSRRSRCVCELRDKVGLDISTVSKHLSVLKQAGIVEDSKCGLQVFYKLKCPSATQFFAFVEGVLKTHQP